MTITPATIHNVSLRTVHRVPDMVAELALPEQLVLADRCDRCGAQALHAFIVESATGNPVQMLFCSHHAWKVYITGFHFLAYRDYRMEMIDWEHSAAEQRTRAIKDGSGKTDPRPIVPLHLAQWDRIEGSNRWN